MNQIKQICPECDGDLENISEYKSEKDGYIITNGSWYQCKKCYQITSKPKINVDKWKEWVVLGYDGSKSECGNKTL